MSLQITSMADIFMILLVFLLKNYSASLTNISPSARMNLPEGKGDATIKETLKIEISPDIIIIDQKPAIKLSQFEFAPADQSEDGTSPTIAKILKDQRTMKPDPNVDPTMIVMADEKTPYSTIKRVVATAAGQGFVDLQLIVVDNE